MSSILTRITEQTYDDLKKRKKQASLNDLESVELYDEPRQDFAGSILKGSQDSVAIIAEIKKASPSKGVIRNPFDPLKIAEEYVDGGAAAISVLTDKPFFQGDLNYLKNISGNFDIPLLRKDFIVDPYQVKEARAYGADAVLLIATVTSVDQLDELLHATKEFGLQALVECYNRRDMDKLDWENVEIFGVNNRDLTTFEVDIHRGIELLVQSPEQIVRVSESGLNSAEDLMVLKNNGIEAALIGECLMRQPSPGFALRRMLQRLKKLTDEKTEKPYN